MGTTNKDFKVKHGLTVADGATFGGAITIAEPTNQNHATTKEYVDSLLTGSVGVLDGGTPFTTEWPEGSVDAGMP